MSTEQTTVPALRTTDLSMSFGGLKVLQGLNLDIQQGEKRSIIGPNGAGKTTLFNILSGAFAPTNGTVEVLGHQVAGARPDVFHSLGLSRSFQVTRVFPDLTVEENLQLARIASHPRRPGLVRTTLVAPAVRGGRRAAGGPAAGAPRPPYRRHAEPR